MMKRTFYYLRSHIKRTVFEIVRNIIFIKLKDGGDTPSVFRNKSSLLTNDD